MAGKSTLDPDNIPARRGRKNFKGHDTSSLGPGDTSDSGSDMKGLDERDDDSSRDLGADRMVGSDEAGLGGGLDQAEEAQLGVTDEELKKRPPRK